MTMKIGFIGLGNMARAMIGGMITKQIASKEDIAGADKMQAAAEDVKKQWGIKTCTDNAQVAGDADVLVLAVKPQFLSQAVSEMKDAVKENTLIISIVSLITSCFVPMSFSYRAKDDKEGCYVKKC